MHTMETTKKIFKSNRALIEMFCALSNSAKLEFISAFLMTQEEKYPEFVSSLGHHYDKIIPKC